MFLKISEIPQGPKLLKRESDEDPNHFMFVLEDTDSDKMRAVLKEYDGKMNAHRRWNVTGRYQNIGMFSVRMDEDSLMAFAIPMKSVQDHVLYVEPIRTFKVDGSTNLWGLDRIDQVIPAKSQHIDQPSSKLSIQSTDRNRRNWSSGLHCRHGNHGVNVRILIDLELTSNLETELSQEPSLRTTVKDL